MQRDELLFENTTADFDHDMECLSTCMYIDMEWLLLARWQARRSCYTVLVPLAILDVSVSPQFCSSKNSKTGERTDISLLSNDEDDSDHCLVDDKFTLAQTDREQVRKYKYHS